MFITWKFNTMNKSPRWLQNWLRQTCNVFVVTFIKLLFKPRDVFLIGCLVEKLMNHIILIWAIKFNLKQVKQKPLEVWITRKVIGFLKFYIFPGYKNINMLLVILFTIFYLVLHNFIFSKKVFHWKLLNLVLPYT